MLVLLRQLARVRRQAGLARARGPRSIDLRHVDAGSCNGCEHELGLATSPFYDLQRFGLDIVASPRHADVLLVTGPVTTRMATAAAGRLRRDARAAAGRRARRLRARLRDPRRSGRARRARWRRCFPSTSASPGCPPTPQLIAEHLLAGLDAL